MKGGLPVLTNLFWTSVGWFAIFPISLLLLGKRKPPQGWAWSTIAIGSLLQVVLGAFGLSTNQATNLVRLPGFPPFGAWTFALDPLGSLLFVVLGITGIAGSLYAVSQSKNGYFGTGWTHATIAALQFIFTSFLLTAQDAIPLLIAWEGMSLCAYAYVVTRHSVRRVRQVAFVTLAVSEVGFLALVIALVLAAPSNGSMTFTELHSSLLHQSAGIREIVFILGVLGFGVKSGVVPMQMWMPRAYEVTPTHLNVLLAGGLLNLGIFGILRVVDWVSPLSAIWGVLLVLMGAIAIFLGALFAVMERHLNMLLAYSSIENVGFMIAGIGLSMAFKTTDATVFAFVALSAVMIQIVSHALAKSLCFLSVGEVQRRTGISSLDALGGLYPQMPIAATGLLVGSLTLAAVAPFSGFTVEWLTLQSMLQVYRTLPHIEQTLVIFAGALTAVGSALAFTAFLRLFAFLFSGKLRALGIGEHLQKSEKTPLGNIAIVFLAALSAIVGFFPTSVVTAIGKIVAYVLSSTNMAGQITPNAFHQPKQFQSLVHLGGTWFSFLPMPSAVIQPGAGISSISPTYILVWFFVFSWLAIFLRRSLRHGSYRSRIVRPWNGGRVGNPMLAQYSATAYSNPYRMFFTSLLRFQVRRRILTGTSMLPKDLSVHIKVTPWLQSGIYRRWLARIRKNLIVVRHIQHGYLWGYLSLFIFTIVALLLLVYWL